MIKSRWEGISGGRAIDDAVADFFASLDARRGGCEPDGPRRLPRRSRPSSRCSASRSSRTPPRPTLRFKLGVSEPTEREIFTIALTAQINVEPARRTHDAATRERLVDLFGEPERWPATTHAFVWTHATHARAELHGRGDVHAARARDVRPRGRGRALLLRACPTARLRWRSTSAGRSSCVARTAASRSCPCRGRARTTWRMPIATWREMMQRHYPGRSWVAAAGGHGRAADALPARARAALVRRLRRAMLAATGETPYADA